MFRLRPNLSPSQPQSQPQAQTKPSLFGGRATVHFNFGAQTGSGDISQTFTPLIYDEPATIDIAQTYETGGLIDVGGSYMVYGDFGVGVSYSHTSGDGDAAIAAQIPHPLFADQPRSASATATGLDHSENAVHISMLYRFAATPKLDVTVGLGPTFFSVNQDLVPTVDVTEASGGPVITPCGSRGVRFRGWRQRQRGRDLHDHGSHRRRRAASLREVNGRSLGGRFTSGRRACRRLPDCRRGACPVLDDDSAASRSRPLGTIRQISRQEYE